VGDSVYVEIHSITPEAFNFLNQVVIQIDRPGGFSELFAAPLANVSTNISNMNSNGKPVVGFFCVSAVSTAGKRLEE
jgi:cobyrinic acid a,c-diamide synthase